MTYQPKQHYTPEELHNYELSDAETELKCAIRDNMPDEYIEQCRQNVVRSRQAVDNECE